MTNGKAYTVKEWFANKLANEIGANITACDIFAVLKETEKAAYCLVSIGGGRRKTTWIPKSVIIEYNEEYGGVNVICEENYEKAVELFNSFWASYK